MTIKIVALSGCGRCASLKRIFSESGIKYHSSTCDDDPDNCDALEALVGENSYPIVLLTNSKNEIFEVLFITKTYQRLSEGHKNENGIVCIPCHSTDSIVDYIKNKLNL